MIRLLRFRGLAALAGLRHGVTTRPGGASRGPWATLNLGYGSGDDRASVDENRRRAAAALGTRGPLRFVRQVHGARVAVVDEPGDEGDLGEADAIATAAPGAAVGVLGADCPGVLLVDPRRRALAVVHSGWRGTAAGVVARAVDTLRSRFRCDASDLRAGIGPGISRRRYEVGPEVADALRAALPEGGGGCVLPGAGDRSFVDLAAAVALQLRHAGLAPEAVETIPACTYEERDLLFSHRRDGPSTGRHALVAAWD